MEHDRNHALHQRDEARHHVGQMRHMLTRNVRFLPDDHDLMQLPLDDIRSLQTRLQQELSKLTMVSRRST